LVIDNNIQNNNLLENRPQNYDENPGNEINHNENRN
jgi:hypothetical protein